MRKDSRPSFSRSCLVKSKNDFEGKTVRDKIKLTTRMYQCHNYLKIKLKNSLSSSEQLSYNTVSLIFSSLLPNRKSDLDLLNNTVQCLAVLVGTLFLSFWISKPSLVSEDPISNIYISFWNKVFKCATF